MIEKPAGIIVLAAILAGCNNNRHQIVLYFSLSRPEIG